MSNYRGLFAVAMAVLGACGDSNDDALDPNDDASDPNRKTVRNASVQLCPGHEELQSSGAPPVILQGLTDEDAGSQTPETCVAWERVGERDLRLRFTGIVANCSVDWEPRATFKDGVLDVILFNTSCTYAGCSCPMGVDLTVEDLTLDAELPLTLHQDEKCKDEVSHPDHHRATLDLASADKGMLCLEHIR
jgi:hypothetical protein